MSDPNGHQVGGDHYATALQHWDVVEAFGIGYLEGCATKYVTRYKKKGGLEDLKKAQHYVEKLIHLHNHGFEDYTRQEGCRYPRGCVPAEVVREFCSANGLDLTEGFVILRLFTWKQESDLQSAVAGIRDLQNRYKPLP